MVAVCVSLGYLLAPVPNIELLSAAVFVCGAQVGPARGALVGLASELIYAGFNPYGAAAPPLFVAQLLGMTAIGWGGGCLRRPLHDLPKPVAAGVAALAGFVLTLVFDVLTNSAIYVTVREVSSYAAVLLGGLSFPWPLAHAATNAVAFGIATPAVLRVAASWRSS